MLNNYFKDELLYTFIVVYTLVVASIIKLIKADEYVKKKKIYSFVGIALILLVVGLTGFIWTLLFTVVTLISVTIIPRKFSLIFFIIFYIVIILYVKFIGISYYNRLINVLVMVFSLKSIGLINDIKNANIVFINSWNRKSATIPISQCQAAIEDIICYFYCFLGMFTGPYYTYRTFYDMLYSVDGIYHEGITDEINIDNNHQQIKPIVRSTIWKIYFIKKLLIGISLSILYLLMNSIDINQYLLSDSIVYSNTIFKTFYTFIWKLFFLSLFMYRMKARYISCWCIMESTYIMLGLGAYPFILQPRITLPPKLSQWDIPYDQLIKSKISYETVKSSNIYVMEFSLEMYDIISSWNPTVNYFMSCYIGEMFHKKLKIPMTMLFSAFWHGIELGYYISFYLTILVAVAQKYFKLSIQHSLPSSFVCLKFWDLIKLSISNKSAKIFILTLVAWFINTRLIEYTILPFFLHGSINQYFSIWKDLYFYGHLYILLLFLCGAVNNYCNKVKKE